MGVSRFPQVLVEILVVSCDIKSNEFSLVGILGILGPRQTLPFMAYYTHSTQIWALEAQYIETLRNSGDFKPLRRHN